MTKELSIENIKKELIDKISNNEEVLEYFEEHYRENGANDILIRYGTKVIKIILSLHMICQYQIWICLYL